MQTYCRNGGIAPHILNLSTRGGGGEWSASHPGCFTSRKRTPTGIHSKGWWLDSRASL